jgi:hypothetical protein
MAVYTVNELLVANKLLQSNKLQQPNELLVPSQSTTPAAPTFSPVAGSYTGTQLVIITGPIGTTAIYFTLDGSTPTTSSQLYNSFGVYISLSETLKAIAIVGGVPSAVGVAVYIIGFTAQTASFFSTLATQPSAPRAAAYNSLITELVNAGVFSKLDGLYVYAAADSPTALTNLTQATYNQTAHGSPTFASNVGFTGANGTTEYLDTGFNPAVAPSPNFTQNSASLFAYRTASPSGDAGGLAGIAGGTFKTDLYVPLAGSTPLFSALNSAQVGGALTYSLGIGLFSSSRLNSTALSTYLNGVPVQLNVAAVSSAVTSADIITLNDGTSGADGTTGTLAAGGMGAGLTDADTRNLYSAVNNYTTAINSDQPASVPIFSSDIATGNATGLSYGTGVARLADGRLVAVYSVGTALNTNSVLYYQLSSNNGLTWGAAVVLSTPASTFTYTEANVMVTSAGTILVNATYYASGPLISVVFQGTVAIPLGSITWSSPITVTSALTNPTSDGQAVQLANGSLMLPLYSDVGSEPEITVVFSTNQGATWGNETPVVKAAITGNNDLWGESGFVQMPNGSVFGILRNDNTVTTSRQGWWTVVSTNGGATWSSPTMILGANTSVSRPSLACDADNNMLVVGRFGLLGTYQNQQAYSYSTDGAGATWSAVQFIYVVNQALSSGYGANYYDGGFWDTVTQTFMYSMNYGGGYTLFQQFSAL